MAAIPLANYVALSMLKATGSGEYIYSSAKQILDEWGITLVPSLLLGTDQGVVADTRLAGRIVVRQGANVLVSDADGTDFTKNMVTILAEGRFGLEIEVPAAFAKVALA